MLCLIEDWLYEWLNLNVSLVLGCLNDALIKLGWTLAVVPELDALTVGGLTAGGGIETTSAKYGLWQHTCIQYEVVTAQAEVIECNQDSQ